MLFLLFGFLFFFFFFEVVDKSGTSLAFYKTITLSYLFWVACGEVTLLP